MDCPAVTGPQRIQLQTGGALAPGSSNVRPAKAAASACQSLFQLQAWDQAQVTDASVLFIMCADLEAHQTDPKLYWGHAPQPVQDILGPALRPFYDGKPQLTHDEGIRSSALAGMTLMLAAEGMGYASCPMVGFDAEAVAKLIKLPDNHVLSFMIAVGKPTQPAWDRGPRLPDKTVIIQNCYPD